MKTASRVESSPKALRWVSLLFLVAAVSAAGCSKKSNEPPAGGTEQGQPAPAAGEAAKPETKPEASAPVGSAPAPSGEHSEAAEHGEAAPAVVPGTTPAEIWSQIQKEQGELAGVIQKTDLAAVHHHAYAIRDLVAAAAAKTQGLGASDAAKVQKIVKDVGTLAEKLDKAGDSGDLTATKTHFASLQQELQLLSPLLGAH